MVELRWRQAALAYLEDPELPDPATRHFRILLQECREDPGNTQAPVGTPALVNTQALSSVKVSAPVQGLPTAGAVEQQQLSLFDPDPVPRQDAAARPAPPERPRNRPRI